MKISYYELLGMIKEGNIPEKIIAHLVRNKSVVYIAEFETEDILLCYKIENENEQDENYHYYLSECLIEYSMFDKCIEIIEEDKLIELTYEDFFENNSEMEMFEILVNEQNKIKRKVNELEKLIKE